MKADRCEKNLMRAIEIMRGACDDAERNIKTADSEACQRVLHSFAWGFANATSAIECAMAAVEEQHEIELYYLENPK
jgi:hypothetical protein